MLVILGSAALVYDVASYAGSSPAFNEAPMRDRDIVELLVDFDHYGNSAAERFQHTHVRVDQHRTPIRSDRGHRAGFKLGIANKQHRSSRGTNRNKKL